MRNVLLDNCCDGEVCYHEEGVVGHDEEVNYYGKVLMSMMEMVVIIRKVLMSMMKKVVIIRKEWIRKKCMQIQLHQNRKFTHEISHFL